MASPSEPMRQGQPVPPPADPASIRSSLSPRMIAEFDTEWEHVLEQAKASKDLGDLHDLLAKWRHIAYSEMAEPGSHFQLLARAERIMTTGHNPHAVPFEDMETLISERLDR